MSNKDALTELLNQYNFSARLDQAPFTSIKVNRKDTNQNFTLKYLRKCNEDLYRYLSKIKDTRSDYVIRILEIVRSGDKVAMICQQASYGTLAKALTKCKRLEENDALFMAKTLLQGHIDLLRNECNWAGNEADIEITDNGIKLSFNNTTSPGSPNPFPELIRRLSFKPDKEEGGILPFPKNKQIQDLIKVSTENASEMSLHPLLKKRDKIFKKKGKSWLGLRETKQKAEYFDETVYFAASNTYGFVRVKVYASGVVDKQILQLHKTRPAFVRILQTDDDGLNYTIISEYANDGNVMNYVARLKSNSIILKEDQIEFFLYSLVQPVKYIQSSNIKSLNTIHIKNIYLENGIPKLGEPVPLSPRMEENLRDKQDVPDFYHPRFKGSPQSRAPEFDTYSLGILLYKLMYTQYPIFPEGKVHVPTTPSYNQRIKTTLLVFLNEGGALVDIESKIEVSDNVKKQIKENKVKLAESQPIPAAKDTVVDLSEVPEVIAEDVGVQGKGFWARLCDQQTIQQTPDSELNKNTLFFRDLENSPFRRYRLITKLVCNVLLYSLLFFVTFINNSLDIFSKTSLMQKYNITIGSSNYTLITPDSYALSTALAATDQSLTAVNYTLQCVIDVKNNYSSFVSSTSAMWFTYVTLGLAICITFVILKAIQTYSFDFVHVGRLHQTRKQNYNISAYVLFYLLSALVLYCHFFIFNYIYYEQMTPCLGGGGSTWYTSTTYLFKDRQYFMMGIFPVSLAAFVLFAISFTGVVMHEKMHYSKLFNPILVLTPGYLALVIMMRIGAYSPYSPSLLQGSSVINAYFKSDYMGIIGIIPELVVLIQLILGLLIDFLYFKCLDQKMKNYIPEDSLVRGDSSDNININV